jgi:hypothetical protein
MQTQFICLDLPISSEPLSFIQQIETRIGQVGQPLRWAIAEVKGDLARIEAVVTLKDCP